MLIDGGETKKDSIEVSEAVISAREMGKGITASAAGLESIAEVAMELVQLPSGRIVPAASEEARAEFGPPKASAAPAVAESGRDPDSDVKDPAHTDFEYLGLSRRAWSQTPSPTVVTTAGHQRNISAISNVQVAR